MEMIKLFINKKGMFFTLIAITLILLFVAAYSGFFIIEDRKAINSRIESMNRFVYSTEEDLSRQLYIFGSRALFIIEKGISEKGIYASNINTTISEMFNGSYNGDNKEILEGATFDYIEEILRARAEKIGINLSINYNSIVLIQDDPWNIKVVLSSEIYFADKSGLASWNRTENFFAYIPIENFEDPLYTISTGGKIIHRINKTIYTPLVSGSDVSNLSSHLNNDYYVASISAPSFLQRLEGNKEPSNYGIESLVNLEKLSSQGILAEDKSCVDYIYFSANNPISYKITGMPSWLKIDYNHLSFYNVSGLAY